MKCGKGLEDAEEGSPISQDNAFRCAHCNFTWYLNSVCAADLILESDDDIVVTRRARPPGEGLLDFPGGFVDPGESAEECVVREVQEELGIEVDARTLAYLGSFPNEYIFGGLSYFAVDLVFRAPLPRPAKDAMVRGLAGADDVAGVELVRFDTLQADDFGLDSTRSAFAHFCEQKKRTKRG